MIQKFTKGDLVTTAKTSAYRKAEIYSIVYKVPDERKKHVYRDVKQDVYKVRPQHESYRSARNIVLHEEGFFDRYFSEGSLKGLDKPDKTIDE